MCVCWVRTGSWSCSSARHVACSERSHACSFRFIPPCIARFEILAACTARRIDCALAHAALFARLPACIARFPTRADGLVALSFHALPTSSHWFRVRFYRVGQDMPCWPSYCSDRAKCKIRNMKSWLLPCSSRGLSGERHHSQHRNKRFDRLSLRAGVQGVQGRQLR